MKQFIYINKTNYIIKDKRFIFNYYKNNNTYKQQKFDCPNEIYDLIMLKDGGLREGPLFTVAESDYRFSIYVSDLFSKYKLKNESNHMNILWIRKSFYNYIEEKLDNDQITFDE